MSQKKGAKGPINRVPPKRIPQFSRDGDYRRGITPWALRKEGMKAIEVERTAV